MHHNLGKNSIKGGYNSPPFLYLYAMKYIAKATHACFGAKVIDLTMLSQAELAKLQPIVPHLIAIEDDLPKHKRSRSNSANDAEGDAADVDL